MGESAKTYWDRQVGKEGRTCRGVVGREGVELEVVHGGECEDVLGSTGREGRKDL